MFCEKNMIKYRHLIIYFLMSKNWGVSHFGHCILTFRQDNN